VFERDPSSTGSQIIPKLGYPEYNTASIKNTGHTNYVL
jgi:hypothetical protein